MPTNKILNLIAIASVAILACSFAATPVNALSTGGHHLARHPSHDGLIKRNKNKKRQSQRCQPRPSSSDSPTPSSTDVAPSSTYIPPPDTTWSPSPSPSPTPSPTPTPSPSGSGKVGIAWPDSDDSTLSQFVTSSTKFFYNWSCYKPPGVDAAGLQFFAMYWGAAQVDDCNSQVVPGYAAALMGPNEPEQPGQSNLSPGDAATLWMNNIQPKKSDGFQLISPAVSSGSAGIPWLQSFFGACGGCTFDYCALHWYGTSAQEFISYVENFYSTFSGNCPSLYITEYADMSFTGGAQDDLSGVFNFYGTVNPWMDTTSYVAGYSAFGIMTDLQGVNTNNAMMQSDGTPSSLGYTYIYDSWA
ncbi:glycosyl hydrolase catalytic core-domain-containing protein [Sparassis latifolia]